MNEYFIAGFEKKAGKMIDAVKNLFRKKRTQEYTRKALGGGKLVHKGTPKGPTTRYVGEFPPRKRPAPTKPSPKPKEPSSEWVDRPEKSTWSNEYGREW